MITTFPRHLLLPRLSYRYIVQKKKKKVSIVSHILCKITQNNQIRLIP